MTIRSLLSGARRQVLCSFYRRTIPLGNRGPIVSFGFDDFPRSAFLTGGEILESYGARGTYYTTPGLMGTSDKLGDLCTLDDLFSLMKKGHELGTQTFRHSSCRNVSLDDFEDDVQRGISEVRRLTGVQANNFAYPYGHVTLSTKRTLGPILATSRGIFPGINGPDVDLNLLRANRVYGNRGGSQLIERLVRQNVAQKGWLIFYTHDVGQNPSEYGCTPELFEFAVSMAVKSGSRIVTMEQLLAEIDIQSAPAPVSALASRR
jgi:peptidoglycan/xylan/chitin deacetylase (PgdA/CDA1 family)